VKNILTISAPDIQDIDKLISMNCEYFAKSEQTNIALNIPEKHYRNYAGFITHKSFESGKILVAKTDGKIVGYLIWEDYSIPLVTGIKGSLEVYNLIKPEIAFVEEMENNLSDYPEFNVTDCAKLMQVAVLPEYQKEGIATKLASYAINEIIDSGYKIIIADCTAENSWHILVKLGFDSISEISYSDFEFERKRPFAELEGKRRLVIKRVKI
jgi:ribosomal protein S18 acetylase RimI-like enzyme